MSNVFITVIFIFLTAFGTISNALFICIIGFNPTLRKKSTHSLLMNLAISDLMLDLSIIVIGICNLSRQGIGDNAFACAFSGFAITMLGTQSLLGLLIIAIDRYRMLVLVKRCGLTRKQEYLAVLTQTIVSFSLALAGYGDFTIQPARIYCVGNWTSGSKGYNAVCTLTLWGTMITVAILYRIILSDVRQTAQNARITITISEAKRPGSYSKKAHSKAKKLHRRMRTHTPDVMRHETNVTKRMVTIVFAIFLAWTGYGIEVVYQFATGINSPYWVDVLSIIMATTGTLFNPLINLATNKRYQTVLFKMINKQYQSNSVTPAALQTPPSPSPRSPRSPRSVLEPPPLHSLPLTIQIPVSPTSSPPTSPPLVVVPPLKIRQFLSLPNIPEHLNIPGQPTTPSHLTGTA